jgi:hypothetical protein
MIQPKYSPKEALKRAKLLMGYDPSSTLTENQQRVKSLINEQSQTQSLRNLLSACSARPQSEGSLSAAAIAAGFNKAFNYDALSAIDFFDIIGGTDDSLETGWRHYLQLMSKGNMDDLCNISKDYESTFGQSFAEAIIGELDTSELSEVMATFTAMKEQSDKEAKLKVDSTEQQNVNWFKKTFPCIYQSDGNVDQQVYRNANNYVYILIKGKSGKQYSVFADGRVKNADGTKTGKKVSCQGSNVTFISESIEKKKLSEQIDDSSLNGGGGGNTPSPTQHPRPVSPYKKCSGEYKKFCKSDVILKVQGCLGIEPDGKFGSETQKALEKKGYNSGFTDKDVDRICNKEVAPFIPGEIDTPDVTDKNTNPMSNQDLTPSNYINIAPDNTDDNI